MDCPENFVDAIHGMQAETMAGLKMFHSANVNRLERERRLNEVKTRIEELSHGKTWNHKRAS